MEPNVEVYLAEVVAVLEDALGDGLTAVWMSGSLATGDAGASSDVDVLLSTRGSLTDEDKDRLVRRLNHSELSCPLAGLDLLAYRATELVRVRRTPRYQFSMSSGRAWGDEVSHGGEYPGGILDLALVRRKGRALRGLDPRDAIGEIPDAWVLEEMDRALRWHRTRVHDPFHDPTGANAVLNACRSLHFLAEGVLGSKTEGARWLLDRESFAVVEEALAARAAAAPVPLSETDVLAFLDQAIERFSSALA